MLKRGVRNFIKVLIELNYFECYAIHAIVKICVLLLNYRNNLIWLFELFDNLYICDMLVNHLENPSFHKAKYVPIVKWVKTAKEHVQTVA